MYSKPRGCDLVISTGSGLLAGYSLETALNNDLQSSVSLHEEIYKLFPDISSIIHIHSEWISLWSKLGKSLSVEKYGYIPRFELEIPFVNISGVDIGSSDYSIFAAEAIQKDFFDKGFSFPNNPAFFLRGNGAIVLGDDLSRASEIAISLEYASKKAFYISKFI